MSTPQKKNRRNGQAAVIVVIVVIVALLIGMTWRHYRLKASAELASQPTYQVASGPLRISITESGTIKARDITILTSGVEDRTTILYIIPEGTRVQTGELLVELDSATLINDQRERTIRYQNAKANFINAQENLEIVKSQAQSDIDTAELTLKFAKDDLNKYIEGEFPKLKTEAEARIKLAEEELGRTEETYNNSLKLYEEKYISRTELQNEEIAKNRKQLDLDLARNNLDLLVNFDYKRNLEQLESDVKQAEMALERTKRKSNANIIQADANLAAGEAEKIQEEEKLLQLKEQIENTRIIAPHPGQVIYATSAKRDSWRGSDEPLKIGLSVHERQELIYLPVSEAVIAEVDIHEASLKKVREGLPVIIQVDALPNRQFLGSVQSIAPLPDPQSMFMNPDLKVYNSTININVMDPALRTGMSCKAEIIVEQYENVIHVPIQAVIRIKGQPHVYVKTNNDFVARPVELGMDNNRTIHIINGLQEGEEISLTPPLYRGEQVDESEKLLNSLNNGNKTLPGEVREKLDNLPPAQPQNQPDNKTGVPGQAGQRPSADQMQQMQQRLQNMSPEERSKLAEQFAGQRRPSDAQGSNPPDNSPTPAPR